ncbi:MAG: ROK family protein [Bacillota bacterium]
MEKKVLSIDIGGHKLLSGVIEENGKVTSLHKHTWQGEITREKVLSKIKERLDFLNNKFDGDKYIGVTIPGLADTEKGIWVYSPFSGIKNIKIVEILHNRYNLPVFIENDVNACAFGERIFGVCQNTDNFFWITVSNGIGGGLVLNGELYEGKYQNAGEIGHITVVEDGFKCGCGKKGCLEAYAAGPAIARRYRIAAELNKNEGNPDAEKIAQLALKGNEIACKIYKKTGSYIGQALAAAVNIINPEKVVFGGGVSQSFDLFKNKLLKEYQKNVFLEANKNVKIEKTGLDYNAALIGIAAIALYKA